MAYLLAGELCDCETIEPVAGAAKTKGGSEIVNGTLGFWFTAVDSGSSGAFIIRANKVLVDCDPAVDFNAGDAVYDDGTTPTGIVNKTSAGRRKVGYVAKEYSVGATKIHIVFNGGN